MAGRSPAAADEARARAHLAARVYGGLFPLAEVRNTLMEVFGRDPESHDGRVDSQGALFAQMAVGGLWRARRAVVVGDPLQLEPVVTVPFTARQALRGQYGVAEEWLPGWTSLQQVADRATRYGTTLPAELPDGLPQVWVGAPLRTPQRFFTDLGERLPRHNWRE